MAWLTINNGLGLWKLSERRQANIKSFRYTEMVCLRWLHCTNAHFSGAHWFRLRRMVNGKWSEREIPLLKRTPLRTEKRYGCCLHFIFLPLYTWSNKHPFNSNKLPTTVHLFVCVPYAKKSQAAQERLSLYANVVYTVDRQPRQPATVAPIPSSTANVALQHTKLYKRQPWFIGPEPEPYRQFSKSQLRPNLHHLYISIRWCRCSARLFVDTNIGNFSEEHDASAELQRWILRIAFNLFIVVFVSIDVRSHLIYICEMIAGRKQKKKYHRLRQLVDPAVAVWIACDSSA